MIVTFILWFRFQRAAKKILRRNTDTQRTARVIQSLRLEEKTLGAITLAENQNRPVTWLLKLSRLNIAYDRALRANGFSTEETNHLIEETNWLLAGPGIRALAGTLRLSGRSPAQVTEQSNHLLWTHLFTAPFRKTDVQTGAKITSGQEFIYGCDVTVCPLQTYYRSENAAHVCGPAACQLDNRMAAEWGVDFHRTQTLAGDATHCDFRFYTRK